MGKDTKHADETHSGKEGQGLGKPVSRRDVLRMAGIGGAGLILGATGVGGIMKAAGEVLGTRGSDKVEAATGDMIGFYGKHQAGITTPSQNHILFAAFDVTSTNAGNVKKMLKAWTAAAAAMAKGEMIGDVNDNGNLPPSDTGEAAGLLSSRLTMTFGIGPSMFDSRFGLAAKRPAALADLPAFGGDELREEWSGGDIGVQVCADDMQVAFHAIRNFARIARGTAVLRWTQEGFQRSGAADPAGATPRNLMGFKDGTGNPDTNDGEEMNRVVWASGSDGAPWMDGGSYMVVRRIRIRVEVWDRSTLQDQEATFGRHRHSGAPLGGKNEFDQVDVNRKDANGKLMMPATSHVSIARGDGTVKILRRSYSYSSGMDNRTGQLDAGLLFICYNRDTRKQFTPIQTKMGQSDKLNEYIVHTGSAIFACFPGVKEGGYIGDTLF
ncbi:iron uptake transporter deferrochelatase/peroxidase subunit [Paenibacillus sp. HB172176]|uniref:iron uptake transporter deferrochelatase/peroxidase subunit n=1 Tax=Paenibacillus sp. HB172176 TaxID=2493690 RepID=UPI00143B196B|nr:iron uptake transporter deferrochelatase/peroxidase subunit [Paenibacillus sp. HB172176]